MLVFVETKGEERDGHFIALALFLCAALSSIAIHQLYGECNRIGVQVRSALIVLIYRKSLRLSRVRGGAGEVINILSTDITRINDAVINLHFFWSAFIEAIAILIMAYVEIGVSSLPAIGFVILLLPIQVYLGSKTSQLSREQTAVTTQRVHLMSELLTAIKLIKFYAWELPFSQKIGELRKKEMQLFYDGMVIKAVNFMVVFSIPVLVSLSSLGMYVALGNTLTAAKSFTVLSVYNTLRYPFLMLPMAVKSYSGSKIALSRLDIFLVSQEVEDVPLSIAPKGDEEIAFDISNSDFKWDGSESANPTLQNITFKVKKGSKVAIVGDVGSGKSSLLAALLGQIRQVKGQFKMYGTTSYVPQQAWLLNMTLRDNILFGTPLDRERYKEVIRVCSLQRDLTLLLAGDKTELAERGANLSGGQRQRTSLARAVYNNSDIILLDDPISAVDQHVGRHIFEECFMKFLKDKTVIVALHQLQYLEQMDHIVIIKKGKIEVQGSYTELMKTDYFSELISKHVAGGEEGEEDDEPIIVNDVNFDPDAIISSTSAPEYALKIDETAHVNVDIAEDVAISTVAPHLERQQLTVRSYKEITPSQKASIVERNQLSVLRGHSIQRGDHDIAKMIRQNEMSVFSVKDLADIKAVLAGNTAEDDEDAAEELKGRLTTEDSSTASSGFADFVAYFRAGHGTAKTSLVMIFFAVVHLIRIGSDYWLRLWVPKIGGFTDAVYLGVYGLFVALFAGGAFLRGYLFAVISARKAHILHDNIFNAILRAPMSFYDSTPLGRILSAFSKHMLNIDDTIPDAALQMLQYLPLGLGALILASVLIPWNWAPSLILLVFSYLFVRFSNPAIEKTKSLEAITKAPVYAHITTTLEGLFSIRSYHAQTRFDTLNIEKLDRNHEALLAMNSAKSFQALYLDFFASIIVYFTSFLIVMFRNDNDMASIAGLALSNVLQMLVFVQWTVRMWGDVNAQMSAVGQLVYYADVKSEAPAEIPETKPPKEWPTHGQIEFKNIVLRYNEQGVNVLKDISFTINPSEKIGIVGRTGSGKSTLLISLLRIVEAAEGVVTIDGVDVKTIGLNDLRTKIAIIPQEPVLFVGTVRSNLDPYNNSSDEEIWKALHAVSLGETIDEMPGKLDSAVIENGANFSLGQRQCFCIARAILAKTSILVLDEATAAIDMATDLFIQNTIKSAFSDLTVLTIAHRLNTIIESDKVLVMEAGKIVEFDEPIKLLNTEGSAFRSLVEQTGEATALKLREIAELASMERKNKKAAGVVQPLK